MTEKQDILQISMFDQDLWCGKMSAALFPQTKEKTSAQSLKKPRVLQTKMPLYLDLRKESGETRALSWETDGALLGEYMTHSFGESPNAAVESRLSQILQDNVPRKYVLSAKACRGILNRANRRGKKLPDKLYHALLIQSGKEPDAPEEVKKPACNQGGMIVYDSRGNGGGTTVPTMTGDHQNRVTDYTAIVLHESGREMAEGVSVSLRSSDCKHPPVKWWDGKDTVQTLTARLTDQRMPDKGSLNAFVDCRNGKESGINGTLQAKESGGSSVNYNNTIRESDTVRRLTPLECERLQGFPDGWTDIGDWTDENGKVHKTTDSNRYKALGNSIALPFWKYLIKRISAMYERDATMASLFDGIAGFPFLWEQINGKGSCLWASEIDSFARAVSERRINGGSETDQTIGRAF